LTQAPHRPWVALLVGLGLAVLLLSGCLQSGETPESPSTGAPGRWASSESSSPILLHTLGDPKTSGLEGWASQFDNTPATYDLDGDGVDEVIAHGADTQVYVFNAETGRVLATLPTKYPPAWHIERVLNGVVVGVLSPGQPPSLVVTDHAAYVAVWRFDPDQSRPDRFVFHKEWEKRMDMCHRSPGMDAAAALADLNGDGALEIVVQTEEMGFYALNADGSTRWSECWSGGNSAPVVDDLDGDGRPEVIVASDAGFISVLDGDKGLPLWTFDAADPLYGISPGSVPVSPTVADLDGQLPKEILFTSREAPDDEGLSFTSFHMAIFAIHQNPDTWQGELLWMRQPEWANPMSNTRLVVRDVDGDGAVDIFGMDWNTVGHYPGNWERLGPAHAFRLNERGEDVWVREIDAWWSNQDIVVADSNADQEPDVLVNGPGEGGDGVWRLSAATGAAEGFLGLSEWKMLRGPLLADLRHDGSLQVLFPVSPMEGSSARGAILVFQLAGGASRT